MISATGRQRQIISEFEANLWGGGVTLWDGGMRRTQWGVEKVKKERCLLTAMETGKLHH